MCMCWIEVSESQITRIELFKSCLSSQYLPAYLIISFSNSLDVILWKDSFALISLFHFNPAPVHEILLSRPLAWSCKASQNTMNRDKACEYWIMLRPILSLQEIQAKKRVQSTYSQWKRVRVIRRALWSSKPPSIPFIRSAEGTVHKAKEDLIAI